MLNLLVAYPYFKKLNAESIKMLYSPDIRFVLDSGAFTAWKSGQPIDLDEYIDFLDSLTIKPWRYFTLDVVGDGHKTKENYYKLLELGYNPVPIYTRGEDIKMIDEYFQTSDLVAIGGLVGTKGNKGFVKNILQRYPKKNFHLLGFTNHNFISYFKPYMCDSSSVFSSLAFKNLRTYVGNGKFINFKKEDFKKNYRPEFKYIERLGIDPYKFAFEKEWVNSGTGKNSIEPLIIRSFVKYQEDIEKFLGTKYFLAAGQGWQVKLIIEAKQYLKENRI